MFCLYCVISLFLDPFIAHFENDLEEKVVEELSGCAVCKKEEIKVIIDGFSDKSVGFSVVSVRGNAVKIQNKWCCNQRKLYRSDYNVYPL